MECNHVFEPRYNRTWPEAMTSEDLMKVMCDETLILEEGMDSCKNKKYIYDICARCGKIVKDEQGETK